MTERRRVAVVGGGIAGLAGAHFLADAQCSVTLFEASDKLGGLGTSFEREGRSHERFYHVMLPSDQHLLELLEDVGLSDRPYWKDSSMGFLYRDRYFRLNTAGDLLRFAALPLIDRLRIGVTGLWGSLLKNGKPLDDVTAEQWLTRLSGRRAFARFWKPLLEAKFGDAYGQIPARWFWTRFQREKGGQKEVKGYPRGGYQALADSIADNLRSRGVDIRLDAGVDRVVMDAGGRVVVGSPHGEEVFDQVLSTLPLTQFENVAAGPLAEAARSARGNIDYQGVVNVVLLLKKSVIPDYWMPVVECGAPFQGIVEATRIIDRSETDGLHLVYLMNYVHRSDELFQRPGDHIRQEYFTALQRLFPELSDTDLVDSYLFRTPFVEPIYQVGYERLRPPAELIEGRVFLSTTAQVYPGVTSWNGSTGLSADVVRLMVHRARMLPAEPAGALSP